MKLFRLSANWNSFDHVPAIIFGSGQMTSSTSWTHSGIFSIKYLQRQSYQWENWQKIIKISYLLQQSWLLTTQNINYVEKMWIFYDILSIFLLLIFPLSVFNVKYSTVALRNKPPIICQPFLSGGLPKLSWVQFRGLTLTLNSA